MPMLFSSTRVRKVKSKQKVGLVPTFEGALKKISRPRIFIPGIMGSSLAIKNTDGGDGLDYFWPPLYTFSTQKMIEKMYNGLKSPIRVEAPGQQLESQFAPEEGEEEEGQPPPTTSGLNETNRNQTLTNPNTLNLNLSSIVPGAPWRPGQPIVEAPGQQFEGPNQPPQQNTTDILNETGC